MPNLSISNSIISKPEHRQMLEANPNNLTFVSSNEGFATSGSVINITGKKLLCTSGAGGNGYAYRTFTVTPGVTYEFKVQWLLVGGGTQSAGIAQLGSTDGGTEYGEEVVGALTSSRYIPITFKATSAIVYLRLVSITGSKSCTWDNISIDEVGNY